MEVVESGIYPNLVTRRAKTYITVRQLLTHTAGFTYWFGV